MKTCCSRLTTSIVLVGIIVSPSLIVWAQRRDTMSMVVSGRRMDVALTQPPVEQPPPWEAAGIMDILRQIDTARGGEDTDSEVPFRVAVFPFGYAPGEDKTKVEKLNPENAARALELQGAITTAIRREFAEKKRGRPVLVLDKYAVTRAFKDSGVDPLSVSPDNTELLEVLKALKLDAAIVGVAWEDWNRDPMNIAFRAKLVVSTGNAPEKVDGSMQTSILEGIYTNVLLERFDIGMFLRSGKEAEWEPIPLVIDKQAFRSSEIYALLPEGSAGKEYKLRIGCRSYNSRQPRLDAMPSGLVNVDSLVEANRLFGVAVLIDGVNSIFETVRTADGKSEPAALVVHPSDATKWVICRPNLLIRAGANGEPTLVGTRDAGHSVLEVEGFQENGSQARVFQFANVGKGEGVVAETLGVTDDIGLISMFFFAQKLKGDRIARPDARAAAGGAPSLGTAAGRPVAKPTLAVNVKFHRMPVHQIHILYRLENECPIPADDRLQLRVRQ